MTINTKILQRLSELVSKGEEVLRTEGRDPNNPNWVDIELSVQWKARSYLKNSFSAPRERQFEFSRVF